MLIPSIYTYEGWCGDECSDWKRKSLVNKDHSTTFLYCYCRYDAGTGVEVDWNNYSL